MSDFSKLELLVESKNAVQNLKKVESSLNKTESAANSLKNTLKTIGLSIGFAALLKQSLQLSESTDALNKKFKTFFGSSGNKELKVLTDNFTLANRSAKELLTTSAKFGSATGMGTQQLTEFSSQLSQLAADVAAFHAIDDVNSVLDRFGAATMGRTQGLREFGVQIDTTSEAFKNQIAIIQKQTGATEAQAKQIAILQEAQRQLQYTQGSAGEQVSSSWQQLNNLFENFKDILAEVGSIFNVVFGPVLATLNAILKIPFVKSTLAWVVALTTLGYGIRALVKLSEKLNMVLETQIDVLKNQDPFLKSQTLSYKEQTDLKEQLIQKEKEYLSLLRQEARASAAYSKIKYEKGSDEHVAKTINNWDFSKMSPESAAKLKDVAKRAQEAANGMSQSLQTQKLALDNARMGLETFNMQLQHMNPTLLRAANTLGIIPPKLQAAMVALNILSDTSGKMKGTMFIQNALTLANLKLKQLDNFLTGLSTSLLGANTAAKNANTAATLANTAAHAGAGKLLLSNLGLLTKIAAKIAMIAGLVLVFVDFGQILVEGIFKGFDNIDWENIVSNKILLPIWKSIEQTAHKWTGGVIGFDWEGIEKEAEKAKEAIEKIRGFRKSFDELDASYKRWVFSSLDLSNKLKEIPRIKKEIAEKEAEIKRITQSISDIQSGKAGVDKRDAVKYAQMLQDTAKRRQQAIEELKTLTSQLDEFNKLKEKLNDIRRSLQDSLDQFKIDTSILYDKKTGRLIDNKDKTALSIANRNVQQFTKEFNDALKGNKSTEEIQKTFERLKGAYMESYRLRMKALESEKDKIIENQKFINDLIKTSIGYQQTSVQGVEASSMKALELQTRESTGPSKEAMKEVAKQSAEIAKIEKQQAEIAKQSYDKFADYVRKFDNYIGKTAGKTGNNQLIIVNY